ncbi:bifunctional GTP diphosphokinase/guanosine-3',5'-bis pyrophosphate 3'-pyrophosphohydrolase [Halieaceae bacterium IMCC14734]|uniref:guanosine-3',5'-bis(diphosphate) 3'-diphosphatase n=1 Tax=Candidatus Litorirhabdus singularis TaxID=2518993 RepID=A0ABT3TF17_9GAMM|nr:bifunctional GTP diphosphokinase/guanosine-3',5'-bis pyrophosphate 3'-pyrophosphohydrolase [Candidatus Litorirhabdus singularis]MCX2980012.1 bifunctional GTP diphosphokinase/guanosine-3',5'-bis pyrophosphate 3'-pyrophosphohydrolase [Candidatus Litorirhabdus singularis]
MQAIDSLSENLSSYLSADQSNLVKRAYYFAEQAHHGQFRRSGEPYVTHPLAVARILADMHMDHQSLMAAMLHDVIEDTGIDKSAIDQQFGSTVAELVDGVSKLTQIEFSSQAEKQAENFQKMALAMAKDIRVILVKLADRLHNMRTLGVLQPEKRRRIAKETLEMYAPIALRLGMNNVRMEFEDLGFGAMHPMRFERIKIALRKARGNRKELVEQIGQQVQAYLIQEGHAAEVVGREKHLHSIYQKMKSKRKSFSEIMDIFAFRIIVDSVDSCYRVLGCVHNLYKPVPGEFKDYIAIPKANGYQSLHTVLMGMHGVPIEIQIRTREMEDMANNGIAAHWLYKSSEGVNGASHARARQWVQGLLEMQQRAGNSLEFIESVKIDLFPDEVYVFSPKGNIMELPRGATAVDFAYAVHTDVGNSCVACRINRRLAPLSEPLQSGQTVEILTAPGARPNPSWFNYAVTAKARTNIRHFLKHQTREDSIALGQRMLDKALGALKGSLDTVDPERLQGYLQRGEYEGLDQLLEDIAQGNRVPTITAQHLLGQHPDEGTEEGSSFSAEPVAIRGTEGFMVSYAKCCHPIPGDAIAGYISSERGMVVHRDGCHNLAELRGNTEKLVPLRWDEQVEGEFNVTLRVELENRRGMIAVLATRINSMDVNILKISSEDKDYQFSYVDLEMGVQNRVHLARIMKRIRTLKEVHKVNRVRH